jgi:hypothetical protein
MIQNSARNGSQGGSGVTVIVGAADGVTEETGVEDSAVFVGFLVGVATTVGIPVTPVLVQDTSINTRRAAAICFIK